jgi:DNA-binding response OmpR family regulator
MTGSSLVHILSVSPDPTDHQVLANIFRNPAWILHEARTFAAAKSILCNVEIDVVVSERDLRPGSWTEVLEWTQWVATTPPLIVASRLADDQLWAEALDLGAFDVLSKPFERTELIRSVRMAWMSGIGRPQNYMAAKLLKAAG